MKMHVILGWNRHAIPSRGAVTPIPQHRYHTFIHSMAKHWATDPAYAEKLERIYLQHGFAALDHYVL